VGLFDVSDSFHQILMLVAILGAHRLCRFDKHRFINVMKLHAACFHFIQRLLGIGFPEFALFELGFTRQGKDFFWSSALSLSHFTFE
jgi:hypothetical protein